MSSAKRRKLSHREEISIMESNNDNVQNGSTSVSQTPPGRTQEVVFSFDTTSSMNPCITQIRTQLTDIITKLFSTIPNLRIAVVAHGDYNKSATNYDGDYVTKTMDFSDDAEQLCYFVKNISNAGVAGEDKCYELVLHQVRTQLSWSPGTQRALVVIGDGCPHPPSYPLNSDGIDWEKETAALKDIMRVKIYSVMCRCQCLDLEKEKEVKHFYNHLAESTGGEVLQPHNLTSLIDIMKTNYDRETEPSHLEVYQREARTLKGF